MLPSRRSIALIVIVAAWGLISYLGYEALEELVKAHTPQLAPFLTRYWIGIAAALALIVGVLMLLASFVKPLRALIPIGTNRNRFTVPCKPFDLKEILELEKIFGETSSSQDELGRLFSYTPSSFWKVVNGSQEIRGYFVIFNLKKAGETALRNGSFNGANPASEHITKSSSGEDAVYVGAVIARSQLDGPATAIALLEKIKSMKQMRVYGKPLTSLGLRIVTKYGYKRVDGIEFDEVGKVYMLDRSDKELRKANIGRIDAYKTRFRAILDVKDTKSSS